MTTVGRRTKIPSSASLLILPLVLLSIKRLNPLPALWRLVVTGDRVRLTRVRYCLSVCIQCLVQWGGA